MNIIRWDDGAPVRNDLAAQLRARPGAWAIVSQDLSSRDAFAMTIRLYMVLDETEFEVTEWPAEDGPYGVRYDVVARCRPEG